MMVVMMIQRRPGNGDKTPETSERAMKREQWMNMVAEKPWTSCGLFPMGRRWDDRDQTRRAQIHDT
jgi:hypothetical protein